VCPRPDVYPEPSHLCIVASEQITASGSFYQSHQATAAAVAVNDLHLLRGMIGRPGAGLYLMAAECDVCWTLVGRAAQGLRDTELSAIVDAGAGETEIQPAWLRGRMKQAAPQALVVA